MPLSESLWSTFESLIWPRRKSNLLFWDGRESTPFAQMDFEGTRRPMGWFWTFTEYAFAQQINSHKSVILLRSCKGTPDKSVSVLLFVIVSFSYLNVQVPCIECKTRIEQDTGVPVRCCWDCRSVFFVREKTWWISQGWKRQFSVFDCCEISLVTRICLLSIIARHSDSILKKKTQKWRKKTPFLNQVFALSLSLSCAIFLLLLFISDARCLHAFRGSMSFSLVSFSLNQQRVKATYRHLNCQVFSLILCRCFKWNPKATVLGATRQPTWLVAWNRLVVVSSYLFRWKRGSVDLEQLMASPIRSNVSPTVSRVTTILSSTTVLSPRSSSNRSQLEESITSLQSKCCAAEVIRTRIDSCARLFPGQKKKKKNENLEMIRQRRIPLARPFACLAVGEMKKAMPCSHPGSCPCLTRQDSLSLSGSIISTSFQMGIVIVVVRWGAFPCRFCLDEQEAVQKKTFTKWVNIYLSLHDPPFYVDNLFDDFKDGIKLIALLEVLSGQTLVRERERRDDDDDDLCWF